MATIVSFGTMLSADEGDEVRVRFEMDEDSIFIDFIVGEDEDEITFAFDPADARRWKLAFMQAARLAARVVGVEPACAVKEWDDEWGPI